MTGRSNHLIGRLIAAPVETHQTWSLRLRRNRRRQWALVYFSVSLGLCSWGVLWSVRDEDVEVRILFTNQIITVSLKKTSERIFTSGWELSWPGHRMISITSWGPLQMGKKSWSWPLHFKAAIFTSKETPCLISFENKQKQTWKKHYTKLVARQGSPHHCGVLMTSPKP